MMPHNTDRNMTREHSSLCGRVHLMLLAQELNLAQPHAYGEAGERFCTSRRRSDLAEHGGMHGEGE